MADRWSSPTGHPAGSTPPPASTEEVDALVEEAEDALEGDLEDLGALDAVAAERDDYLDRLRRLQADFENYRKRMLKQQAEHEERATEGLVVKLLPVLDNFDLALGHGAEDVAPVHRSLLDVLEAAGLERIDPAGQPFDPNEHDAVQHEPGDGEPEVIEVHRAGYRWKGRVLRPAMVKVKG
ncbi:MAG: nucleotide exchange factor GrpE [Actinobacteria bacterium]|nr:MAG: nucleotide exchange factor GrpE [Actinomycetota bacterium]